MKKIKVHKLLLSVTLLVAICLCFSVATVLHLMQEQQLIEQQMEALAELDRMKGEYDEQSIVLQSTSKARAEELAELFDAKLRITEDGRYAKLTLPEGKTIRDVYANDANRKYIEEMSADYQARISELSEEDAMHLPTRPQYTVSDLDFDQQTYLDYLNMSTVWNRYTGSGITVAVIDTGIDTDHPEFVGRISEYSYNATEDKIVKDWKDKNGTPDWSLIEDEQGHGTAVTGVIAASMNTENVVGIAPNVTILTIKAECDENGTFKRTSDLVFGLYYAIERDVQVVNMSFGTYAPSDPFVESAQLAYDSDVICVAAAGNNATTALCYPAANPNVISIGALAVDSWELADYSNYGENSDLVAPGTTYTTLMGGGYGTMDGTSLASPIVTGAIALYMQSDRYTTLDEVREILYASCYDLGSQGNDWDYGFGALDISAFLLEERGTITFDMLTDEVENTDALFIRGHALQELPEPERLYAVFDGWYYDDTCTQAVEYYTDAFEGDLTLYAKWVNEDDGVPYTYVILDDGTVEIRSYTGHRRYITIPEKIEGRVVSSIGDFAFAGQTRLREVGLPSGLTKIGRYAFQNCANLIQIEIPQGVKTIEESAFANNTRLSSVAFLGNSKLTTIGQYAFEACGKLERIELPAMLQSVDYTAFCQAVSLHTINVQKTNPYYSSINGVLFNHSGDTLLIYPIAHGTDYTLPEQTTTIEAWAFGYARIHTIDLNKVVSIGASAFRFASLQELVIPDGVTSLGSMAFAEAIDLASVRLGRGLTQISSGLFYGCSALTEIVIPKGIQIIESSAFSVSGLHTVTFEQGSVLTEIGAGAFAACEISEIEIPASVSQIKNSAFFGNPLVQVDITRNIELRTIGGGAFEGCDRLENIFLPANLETIEAEAFSGCRSLKTILLPSQLKTIDWNAFFDSGLTRVTVPKSVTYLGYGCFACCESLTAIEVEAGNAYYRDIDGVVYTADNETIHSFPAGKAADEYIIESTVRTIMPWSFSGANLLGTVVVPEGLAEIGDMGFYLSGAKGYSLPSTLTRIGEYSFSQNHNLISLVLPEGVMEIGDHCFESSSTKNYSLPSTLTVISQYAFRDNYNLTSITLPETLVQIAEGAFSECKKLRSIHIPDNVLQIGRYAFAEDWNLYSVTFNATSKLPRISYGAFAYSGLRYFTVPANVSTMAQKAFEGCKNLTSITFAENSKLESISAYMFDGCTNLQSITFQNGSALTSIQAHGLEGMDNLTSIDFGDAKVTNIDNFAFRFCESLSTLNLPSTVTNIGRYAFYGCKALSELTIPAPVEHIGSYAFLGTNEIDLYFASDVLPAYLDENWDHSTRGYYVGVTDVTTDGDFKYATLTSGDVAIIEYLGSDTHVDLSTLNFGAPITAIGGSAFKDSTVTSIVLPNTLTSIQAEAFQYTKLESITIPANVTFIGREAFAHTALKTLTFAKGSKLTVIEQYAFEGTENLTSVTLPKSLTTMGTGVFLESGLTTLVFENGIILSEIPQRAFAETKLTKVALPDSVTLVNHNAFNGVETLKSVSFGKNEGIRLMSNAFYQTGLTSLTIPANVTYIGEYCFVALSDLKEFKVDANNPNYTAVDGLLLTKSGRKLIAVPAGRTGSLTVPKSVEEIGFGAFEESKLSEILFHADANILTFGYRAFFKAEGITQITIPASVVSIDYYAFAYCKNLQTVTFAEGNRLKGIYEGAFLGDINLTNITIPDSIVEISDFAFYGCSKIDKLPISENNAIKGIYDYAFAYTGLKGEFTAPETLWDIGNYAFMGTKLTKVTIPDTNKKILVIGIGAFEDCNKITEITLPFIGASYEDDEISWFGYIFGAGAYEANEAYVPKSLKTVTISDGITTIYTGGFAYCTGLETINVPHSVSVLWNDAFVETTARYELTNTVTLKGLNYSGCLGTGIVGRLELADGLTSIGWHAFKDCSGLTDITIPDSVTMIGSSAFEGCSGLTGITIPDSVTEIGSSAFAGCNGLTSITIPDSVTEIADTAFSGCVKLTEYIVSEQNTVYASYDGILYNKEFTEIISVPKHIGGSVQIFDQITAIEPSTFNRCKYITSIIIPDSVTKIGRSAFEDCTVLSSITLGKGVTAIDQSAFRACSSLYEIRNNSSLSLDFESRDYGEIAYYAKTIRDRDGNTHYKGEANVYEWIDTPEGFRFLKENETYTLVSYLGTEDTVMLPSSIFGNTYKILNFTGIKCVILPDNMTSIDDSAFKGCSELTSITIPTSVTEIGPSAFYGCSGLTSITIPDSVTQIGASAFFNCRGLTSITIPGSVTEIGASAFSNCNGLTGITIPDSVTKIGASAFSNCNGLTSITIPDSVTQIGASAFSNCRGLTSITIPDSVTKIGASAFFNCRGLTSITIPDGVTQIGMSAFQGCRGLTSIQIPSGLTRIESDTFANCEQLVRITIPAGVTRIESGAFDNCKSLVEFIVENGNQAYASRDGILYNKAFTTIISVPSQISGNVQIPEGITSISASAFLGCRGLTGITIPNSVTQIGSSAFEGCSGLTGITIPAGVTQINSSAFEGCSGLTSVTIPDTVTKIGSSAFEGCSGLTGVTIPAGVTQIASYVFQGCSGLTSVTIPDTITQIGISAFEGCSGLTSVTIPDTVTQIGMSVFEGCSGLTSVTIPNSVTKIDAFAFMGCSRLSSITIPASVTEMGVSVFNDCTGLREYIVSEGNPVYAAYNGVLYDKMFTQIISVPLQICGNVRIAEGVTVITGNAFSNRKYITSLSIPNSVTTIEDSAFRDCTALWNVTLGEGLTTIGTYAFFGCNRLHQIQNNSTLPLTLGISNYGFVANYARVIIDKDGNKVMTDSAIEIELIETADGFCFLKENDIYTLISYRGFEDTITLPKSIRGSSYTIYRFRGGKNVIIPDGITEINESAFENCQELVSISIPGSVTKIGANAFHRCSRLKNVTIGHGVTQIGNWAFAECGKLMSVSIPSSVTEIGSGAFTWCGELKSIVLAHGVTKIGSSAFAECAKLMSVSIPSSVTEIGLSAFYNCGKLVNATIPQGVVKIGSAAFDQCGSLSEITIPDSVTYIGARAFTDTALYLNPASWSNGLLIVDGWLIEVQESVQYLPLDEIKAVAASAYANAKRLKNPIWSSDGIEGATNAETIIVSHLCYTDWYFDSKGPSNDSSLTLQSIVLLDSVGADELRLYSQFFSKVSGITIFVEANEEDLRWDDNFPGWNYGNRVIYGGDWTWANFYDENGHVVRSKPRRTSEVIRLPVLELSEKQELIGWDLDGDGKADSVPATSVVDVNARPVIRLSYTPGDINGDNTVDETDIFVLRQYLVGIKVEVVVGALDPNGDGFTNMRDVALLAQYIAGLTAVLH